MVMIDECSGSLVESLTQDEELPVRASLEALHCVIEHFPLLTTGTTQEELSLHE